MDQAEAKLVKLEFIEPATNSKGRKVAKASYNMIYDSKKWKNALVGYVFGDDPDLASVYNFIALNWKKFGDVRLRCRCLQEQPGVFIFVFETVEQGQQILDQGPLFLDARAFILKRWDPFVSLTKESFDYVNKIWLFLEEVRVEYEWLPPLCVLCKEFGHLEDDCSLQ
ncbi:hypothetical protein Tsubulata_032172 [Turnera subulata]|uniref:DUF4283 domain-containing protein n=1 Tax=Turnera subulata TaxID=218843 RepID=A0A9Q0IZ32_9ROSI|nr:hypothetical protein Tsubulata_032172 [Turnera subulata]